MSVIYLLAMQAV